jgi:2-iminobutanoate/2-iminopropanoate deaminase
MHRRHFVQLPVAASLPAALALAPEAVRQGKGASISPIDKVEGYAYAQSCLVEHPSKLLFVSGQVPADAEGDVPADYPSQYRLAWTNVRRQLEAAGMGFDNLVKVTIFLSDRALIAQSAGLRQEILGDRSPALTIVIAGIFDAAWLLEIEAIAAS